jgi:hypothetical protein
MITTFRITHFDKDQKPKRLQISYNEPYTSDKGYLKDGNVIVSIFSDNQKTGFQLSTGDVADIISALSDLRKEILQKSKKIMLDMGKVK